MIQQQKADIVTNIFRRLLHIQDGVTNMYMGNGIFYSNSEMLNETFYIYKAENDSSIQCGNIDSYNGKKIGVLKSDQRMVAP